MIILAEYQELIRDFEKIRQYILDFYIYGLKSRTDFKHKSSRTYDNERRRIESYLKDFITSEQDATGKRVSISFDSSQIFINPLYSAWKSKSFTNNDIILHFFMLDLLQDGKCYTVKEIADKLLYDYDIVIDVQIIRLKAKEYENLGLLKSQKVANTVCYSLCEELDFSDEFKKTFQDMLYFFSSTSPLGLIGDFILDKNNSKNNFYCFKHNFIVHTLEDQVLLSILDSIHKKQKINYIQKNNPEIKSYVVPLKILVSTQTGRRYLCGYDDKIKRFTSIRLDNIYNVNQLNVYDNYDEIKQKIDNQIKNCWGVSFGGKQRNEEIFLKLHIDEKYEVYVLERLYREGRNACITRLSENTFLYHLKVNDSNEVLPWIKTFMGRILELSGTNKFVINKFYSDIDKHYKMYKGD